MTTAQVLCERAYKQAQYESTTFGSGQPFPQSIALELFNTVVKELNRWGPYDFAYGFTALSYSAGVNTYNMTTLGIEVDRIKAIERTLVQPGQMTPMQERIFREFYRRTPTLTKVPEYYTIAGQILEFDSIPDQDYGVRVYNYKNIPEASTLTTDYGATDPVLPTWFEDILTEGVLAYLAQRRGRPDFPTLYQAYQAKATKMKANLQRKLYIPNQMPAAF